MRLKQLILFLSVIFWGEIIFAQQENTISESGNIGIGTTSPETTLDVHGSVKIDSVLNVKDSAVFEKNMRVQQDMRIDGDSRFNNVQILGNLETEGGNKFMGPIQMTGVNQNYSLEENSFLFLDSNGNAKKTPFDSVVNVLKSGITAEIYQVKLCPNEDILAPTWANGVNKIFYACPQVNVGIGTNNPLVKLDVRGTAYTNSLAINTNPTALDSKLFHLKSTYSLSSPTYGASTIFLIENIERPIFQINNDGKVRTREVIVNLDSSWPDYVFQPNYSLRSFEELRAYIYQNKHLPNIPTATEVENGGINLGEMNKLLVEKVEELTLYILELEKRVSSIEQETTKN